jgi:hypothetical protein
VTKRVVCAALLVAGLAAIGVGWALAARDGPVSEVGATGAVLTVGALLGLLAGAALLHRQPDQWRGPLLQLVALSTFVGFARIGVGPASSIFGGIWLATILLPGVLAVVHPNGIVERWARRTVWIAVLVTAALAPLIVLAANGRARVNSTWWETAHVRQAAPSARALFAAHTVVVVVAVAAVGVVLIRRALRSDRAARRVTNPVAIPALLWAAVTTASQLARLAGPRWALAAPRPQALSAPATILLLGLPLLSVAAIIGGMAWVELIEPRLQRATAGLTLGGDAIGEDVTTYLRRALVDPSVTIFFRRPGDTGWLDGRGASAAPAFDDTERAIAIVERDGVKLGAIEYDVALSSRPDAVELALAAAGLAIESAGLTAEAAARAEDSRRVAARLVTSADSARDQLEQRLTGGPLVELDAIDQALTAGDLGGAADRLQGVATAVRNISHGLYPTELTDGGLAAVLTHVAAVPAERFPPAVEITAFLATDGDPGARIAHEPSRLAITLSRPPSDPTLLDRVAALGGTIDGSTVTVPVAG